MSKIGPQICCFMILSCTIHTHTLEFSKSNLWNCMSVCYHVGVIHTCRHMFTGCFETSTTVFPPIRSKPVFQLKSCPTFVWTLSVSCAICYCLIRKESPFAAKYILHCLFVIFDRTAHWNLPWYINSMPRPGMFAVNSKMCRVLFNCGRLVPPRLHRLPRWTDQILTPAPSGA
jgi:hypothetical protein